MCARRPRANHSVPLFFSFSVFSLIFLIFFFCVLVFLCFDSLPFETFWKGEWKKEIPVHVELQTNEGKYLRVDWRKNQFEKNEKIQTNRLIRGYSTKLRNGRWYLFKEEKSISTWHDIALREEDELYNFVCEIPKYTRVKFETSKEIQLNPIVVDVEGVQARLVKHPYLVNYGMFPQTYSDPNKPHSFTHLGGDGDPLDVLEIGSNACNTGDVLAVKILGVLGMIDNGTTDWKIIAISANDLMANYLNTMDDLEVHFGGLKSAIVTFFSEYKRDISFQSPAFLNKDSAIAIVKENSDFYELYASRR